MLVRRRRRLLNGELEDTFLLKGSFGFTPKVSWHISCGFILHHRHHGAVLTPAGLFGNMSCRFTQACSTRSSGPVSRTACRWTRSCCPSWWRRRGTPRTWWASGTWACTRRSACPPAAASTPTSVGKCYILCFTVERFPNNSYSIRLPDRQRGLLHSHPLLPHLCSEPEPLRSGPEGWRRSCHGIRWRLFHWAAEPESHRHRWKTRAK